MNLGVSVDITRAAIDKSALVIAQANPMMPKVRGDGWTPPGISSEDSRKYCNEDRQLLALPSTADDGRISGIVPFLLEGSGVFKVNLQFKKE